MKPTHAIAVAGLAALLPCVSTEMNVLFIAVDDLRPTLGCYGDGRALTPNIDRLASRGTLFTHAYCQQAVSNPSRASILTGLRPDQTGVTDLNTHFREKLPNAVTLPQLFKNNGYYTAATGKIFHSGGRMRDDVSWSEQAPAYDRREYVTEQNLTQNAGKAAAAECADVADEAYPDGQIARDAIRFLNKASRNGEPFFLAVGFKKPHLPFCAPARYWEMYTSEKFGIDPRSRPEGSPDVAFHDSNELRGYNDIPDAGPVSPKKEQELWHGYYTCVSYMDGQLGKVMDELERLGLADNTAIVLFGDHGYHLGEQELWCKSTNFELDNRIPLIVYVPGQKRAGGRSDAIVEAVDIYPTLAAACGLQVEGLSGVSLLPLLDRTGARVKHTAFSQFPRPYEAITRPVATTMGYSVRTRDFRATRWYDLKSGDVVADELYLIGKQGVESENLSGQKRYRKTERKLTGLLDGYRRGVYNKETY
jgi:iduronate 2-sulfatase